MNTSVLFLAFVLFTLVMTNKVPIKSDNYGPFKVIYKRFEVCKGPKVKNVADFSTNLTMHGNRLSRTLTFFFPTKTTLDGVKIALYSVTDNSKKLLYNYRLNQPCTHFHAAAMIKTFLNSSDCVIQKGSYHFAISPEDTAKSLMGQKIFYGIYLFKSTLFSKEGNIMCLISEQEVAKKT